MNLLKSIPEVLKERNDAREALDLLKRNREYNKLVWKQVELYFQKEHKDFAIELINGIVATLIGKKILKINKDVRK